MRKDTCLFEIPYTWSPESPRCAILAILLKKEARFVCYFALDKRYVPKANANITTTLLSGTSAAPAGKNWRVFQTGQGAGSVKED